MNSIMKQIQYRVFQGKENLKPLFDSETYLNWVKSKYSGRYSKISSQTSSQLSPLSSQLKAPHRVILLFSGKMPPLPTGYQKTPGHNLWQSDNSFTAIYKMPGIGAPITGIIAEQLIAMGAKELIILGMAGSLVPNLSPGDLVICDGALSTEGVSKHYYDSQVWFKASESLVESLHKDPFVDHSPPLCKVQSWTTDAPYRETPEEIRFYRDQGISVVDMEASALFAISLKREVQASAVFVISDILSENQWNPQFDSQAVLAGIQKALAALISHASI